MLPIDSAVVTSASTPVDRAAGATPQDPDVFGALGPVLIFTFVLWAVVVAAVGVSV